MHNAETILVIILSSALSIFIILGIVLLSMAIKLVKQARMLLDRAENAVELVGSAAQSIRNVSGPLAAVKLIRTIVKQASRKGK